MSNSVKPIPDGYHSITPYITVKNAVEAIEFYKKAFGAIELLRMPDASGRISHAEIRIGDSVIMMSDEHPEMGVYSPQHYGGAPVGVLLYVENCDAVFAQAVAAGATVQRPLADQFYGDRSGGVVDPFGFRWYISTHIKDVSMEELQAAGTSA